jgi:hypothetical protein
MLNAGHPMDHSPHAGESMGLCASCRHVRPIRSDRGALFFLCMRSTNDPRFPKYPRLPVLSCAGYEACSGNVIDAPNAK